MPSQPIVSIAATQVAGGGREPAADEDVELPIRMDEILYMFTKGAVGLGPLIIAPWTSKLVLAENAVYLRRSDGLYRAHFSALKTIKVVLPDNFQQVSRSVVANLARVNQLQLQGGANRTHTLSYAVEVNLLSNWGFEQVKVGREYLRAVRARFGFPKPRSGSTPQSGASASRPTVHPVRPGLPPGSLLYQR